MKFATKFEIQKGLKYEIFMKFNGNLKFATKIWNINVILLSDPPLAYYCFWAWVNNHKLELVDTLFGETLISCELCPWSLMPWYEQKTSSAFSSQLHLKSIKNYFNRCLILNEVNALRRLVSYVFDIIIYYI